MNNKRFKKGDRVKCSWFLYKEDSRFIGMVGIFSHYNKYGDDIAYIDYGDDIVYINFGQSCESISCFTEGIKLSPGKNEQLLFNFMLEKG